MILDSLPEIMTSKDDALRAIGRNMTRGEAETIADRLENGQSIGSASKVIPPSRQHEFRELIRKAGVADKSALATILRAIAGAKSRQTQLSPLWTMPGALIHGGPLMTSVIDLVENARMSITCATYNFQESSQFWAGLRKAAHTPGIALRVYVDRRATSPSRNHAGSPTAHEIATQLHPGRVLRTKDVSGKSLRSHAKFLIVDHRFLVVTSANFSWSAENMNVEFGVRIDSPSLAEAVEREMTDVEESIYEVVPRIAASLDGDP